MRVREAVGTWVIRRTARPQPEERFIASDRPRYSRRHQPLLHRVVHAVEQRARAEGVFDAPVRHGFDLAQEGEMLALMRMQRVDSIVCARPAGSTLRVFVIGRARRRACRQCAARDCS